MCRRFMLGFVLMIGILCNSVGFEAQASWKMNRIRGFQEIQRNIKFIETYYGIPSLLRTEVNTMTPMEALDKVKERYATNFEKVDKERTLDEYYYRLGSADYYLVYEGLQEDECNYLIHLFEFVVDDAENGIGHTVTYGWYSVNKNTGQISEYMSE